MEAVASGALVFVDDMHVHRPHPMLDDVHVVYYDNHNKSQLFDKLDMYRRAQKHSRVVALQGYLHAMKYHRAVSLIDYFFRTVHLQQAMSTGTSLPIYTDTGFDMRQRCLDDETRAAEALRIARQSNKHQHPSVADQRHEESKKSKDKTSGGDGIVEQSKGDAKSNNKKKKQ
jgi:hypothetical protein